MLGFRAILDSASVYLCTNMNCNLNQPVKVKKLFFSCCFFISNDFDENSIQGYFGYADFNNFISLTLGSWVLNKSPRFLKSG